MPHIIDMMHKLNTFDRNTLEPSKLSEYYQRADW